MQKAAEGQWHDKMHIYRENIQHVNNMRILLQKIKSNV